MLALLRLMFPYMVLVCLAAVLIGMANARGHFFVPALGSVVLNVIMIGSVLFLAPHLGKLKEQQVFGLAIGVVVAGPGTAAVRCPSRINGVLTAVRGPLVLMCAQGYQSSLAAATLQALGVVGATDMIGGFEAWRARGLPVLPGHAGAA